ncbi:MAG: hypothetical protein L0H75_10840 [Nitrosospira sp.]|nr:hypothetical protein [Nitrosospira sp.]
MTLPVPNVFRYLLMLCGFLAGAFPFAPVSAQNDASIEFDGGGQTVKALSLSDLGAIAPAVSLKVFEIHENKERTYRAFPARPIFDKVFGKDWEKAREIVFTSADGYQPSVPVAKFLAHDAYLAFAYEDGAPFTLTNRLKNDEIVLIQKRKPLLQKGKK